MATSVKTRIIRIGNSQGIRIPKLLLDQANLGEAVELEVQDGRLIIRPDRAARTGWDEQFQLMAERGDDYLLDEPIIPDSWDLEEWVW